MSDFAVGDKVLIKSKKRFGYICDDTDSDVGHFIVDCYDFMDSKDPSKYLVDAYLSEIEHAE